MRACMLKLPYAVLRYRRRVERWPCCWWPLFCVFSHRPPRPPSPTMYKSFVCLIHMHRHTSLSKRTESVGLDVVSSIFSFNSIHTASVIRQLAHVSVFALGAPKTSPRNIQSFFNRKWIRIDLVRRVEPPSPPQETQPKRSGRKTEKVSLTFVSEYLFGESCRSR